MGTRSQHSTAGRCPRAWGTGPRYWETMGKTPCSLSPPGHHRQLRVLAPPAWIVQMFSGPSCWSPPHPLSSGGIAPHHTQSQPTLSPCIWGAPSPAHCGFIHPHSSPLVEGGEVHFRDERTEVWRGQIGVWLASRLEPCLTRAQECPRPALCQGAWACPLCLPATSRGLGSSGLRVQSSHISV